MRILIAVDSFKGTLSAAAAAAAIARGVRRQRPDVATDLCPLADGGEGTADVIATVLGGEWIEVEVSGPLAGQRVAARYLYVAERERGGGAAAWRRATAVIDLAAASGLTLVPRDRLDPLRATTFGTGELVRHAVDRGARRIWLALGGSATVDGGVGIAMALGWRFLDREGAAIAPGGGGLAHLAIIEPPSRDLLHGVRVRALRDVENPLLGAHGAAAVFGPQKGATTPEIVERLERGLERLAEVVERDLGRDLSALVGGGAAGGAGAGAVAFLGARLVAGGALVLRLSRFDQRVRRADLVITGEGRLDAQSLDGKVVSAVTRAAARRGVPVAAVAGRVTLDPQRAAAHGIVACEAAAEPSLGDADALARAEPLLEAAAARLIAKVAAARPT